MAEVTGILLAAGFSSRFGASKLLLEIDGQPLILRSVAALAPCDQIIAVVRADGQALQSVLRAQGVTCVVNPEPVRGMGYSIACAVNASSQSSGWCILPADMPSLMPSTTRQVVDVLRSGAVLAAPYYQGQRGHPVGFGARFFDELTALDGDIGARHILQQYADLLTVISTDDAGVLNDIDVPEDLEAQGLACSRDQLLRN